MSTTIMSTTEKLKMSLTKLQGYRIGGTFLRGSDAGAWVRIHN